MRHNKYSNANTTEFSPAVHGIIVWSS